jgi:hypothetical protein
MKKGKKRAIMMRKRRLPPDAIGLKMGETFLDGVCVCFLK